MKQLIIGTRGSSLALNQANEVKEKILSNFDIKVKIKVVKTEGDIDLNTPSRKILDKGFYTKEIEQLLNDSKIDLAVHSMKDLPLKLKSQFEISAVMKRRSPMDILITKRFSKLKDLPFNSTIGVGSLRRRLQLKLIRPDFQMVDVRGNIGTRIDKMYKNNWDGLIIAKAALERLNLNEKFIEFNIKQMIPASCQGIVAVESLKNRSDLKNITSKINHPQTYLNGLIEREIALILEGGCKIPVGCYSDVCNDKVNLHTYIATDSGEKFIIETESGLLKDKKEIINSLIKKMNKKGLQEILNERKQ